MLSISRDNQDRKARREQEKEKEKAANIEQALSEHRGNSSPEELNKIREILSNAYDKQERVADVLSRICRDLRRRYRQEIGLLVWRIPLGSVTPEEMIDLGYKLKRMSDEGKIEKGKEQECVLRELQPFIVRDPSKIEKILEEIEEKKKKIDIKNHEIHKKEQKIQRKDQKIEDLRLKTEEEKRRCR